jgi:hypothetical protein
MDLPYDELDSDSLNQLLEAYRTTLKILLEQNAKQGSLHAPTNLAHQISDTQIQLKSIKKELLSRNDKYPQDKNETIRTNKSSKLAENLKTLSIFLPFVTLGLAFAFFNNDGYLALLSDRFTTSSKEFSIGIGLSSCILSALFVSCVLLVITYKEIK